MNEFLMTLLQAVIIAAVPVITGFAAKCLNANAAQAASRTDNEKAQGYIKEATAAVTTAVAYTTQTYVEALKNSATFTPENQKEALNKAVDKALGMMTESAAHFLDNAYGDAAGYLAAKIEEEIRKQKNEGTLLLSSAIEMTADD